MKFLKDIVFDLASAKYARDRKEQQLEGKMEHFVATYGAPVRNTAIHISVGNHGYEGKTGFITCYVRLEYLDKSTKFVWFDDIEAAIMYADDVQSKKIETDMTRVVGPYFLPQKGFDLFR